jgi:hypothetical protein
MEGAPKSKRHRLVGNDFITNRTLSTGPGRPVSSKTNLKPAKTKLVTDIALPRSNRPAQLKPFSNHAPHETATENIPSVAANEPQQSVSTTEASPVERRGILKRRFFRKK